MRSTNQQVNPFLDLDYAARVRLRGREREAMGEFYELYVGRVYGYVYRLVQDVAVCEDLTQDIFLHMWHALENYDPQRELRPWVFTIATNKVRDWWRRQRHAELEPEEDRRVTYAGPPATPSPREQAQAVEIAKLVAAAVGDLPEIARTTLVLHYYEGLSFQEIAAIVGRTEVAIRKRYSRALAELRERLQHLREPPGGDS